MNTAVKTTVRPIEVFDDEEDYFLSGRNFGAVGHLTEEGFIVYAGSTIAPPCDSFKRNRSYSGLRERLIEEGVIDSECNDHLTKDVIFKSVSQAASVIAGAILNGRDSWRTAPDADGAVLTFGEAHPKLRPTMSRKEERRLREEREERERRRREMAAIKEMRGRGVTVCWFSRPGVLVEWRGHLPVPKDMICADGRFAQ